MPVIDEGKKKGSPGTHPLTIVIILFFGIATATVIGYFVMKKQREAKLRNLLDEYEDGETGEKKSKKLEKINEVDLNDYWNPDLNNCYIISSIIFKLKFNIYI